MQAFENIHWMLTVTEFLALTDHYFNPAQKMKL